MSSQQTQQLDQQQLLHRIQAEVQLLASELSKTKKQIPILRRKLATEQARVAALQEQQANTGSNSLKVQILEQNLQDKDRRIRELEAGAVAVPLGPELKEICAELGRAREKEKIAVDILNEKEAKYTERIRELEFINEEQRQRLKKYDELQKKWTAAARMDEQKMRELHARIEELEAIAEGGRKAKTPGNNLNFSVDPLSERAERVVTTTSSFTVAGSGKKS